MSLHYSKGLRSTLGLNLRSSSQPSSLGVQPVRRGRQHSLAKRAVRRMGGGLLLLAAMTALCTAKSAMATTYYVSNSGQDSNDGKSQNTAWRTMAKVNSYTFLNGDQVLLNSTSVWHEELDVHAAGMRFGAYGNGRNCSLSPLLVASCSNMPILDGADVISGWSVQNGATYRANYTSAASKGFVDSLYSQTTPLTLVGSVGAVNATPGSLYSDGGSVYVHLLDGSNPAYHTIEVSGSRAYGVYLGGYNNTNVDGLEIVRSAKSGILAYDAQTTAQNLTIQNNVLFNIGDTGRDWTANAYDGIVERFEGGIMMQTLYGQYMTGLTLQNNWVGEMDFQDMVANNTQAAIQVMSSKNAWISGNKVAAVHGFGIQVTDGFVTTCTAPTIIGNEVANGEDHIVLVGCQNAQVIYNVVHNGVGSGIAIGNAFFPPDANNQNDYLGWNEIHDLMPGFGSAQFDGVDVNHAINGIAVGNNIYRVSAANMSLEATSYGWTLMGNQFDASGDVLWNGQPTNPTSYGLLMYLMQTATPVTLIANNFNYDPIMSRMDYGALNGGDSTHLYTKAQFNAFMPGSQAAISAGGMPSAAMTFGDTAMNSAWSITAPTNTVHISGTAPISTINVPGTPVVGCFQIWALGAWTTNTAGNIHDSMTATPGTEYMACYNGSQWWIR